MKKAFLLFCVVLCSLNLLLAQDEKDNCTYWSDGLNGPVVSADDIINITDSISVFGSMTRTMGSKYLYIQIKVSDSLLKVHGGWPKGQEINIHLMDSQIVTIKNWVAAPNTSSLSADINSKVFSEMCYIKKDDINKLKKSEIEKIEIEWTKKSVTYFPSNAKFFIDQIPCVEY